MTMRRTDRTQVLDPRAELPFWRAAGLSIRPSIRSPLPKPRYPPCQRRRDSSAFMFFRGIEDLTLFLLSQWADESARAAYLTVSAKPRAATDAAVPNISRDWRDLASPYRTFVSDATEQMGCLVVIRQPLKQPDHQVQREWVDTVIAALESETDPMPGLCAATFFLSADGTHVLNLAEWTSADAHRAALQRGSVGPYGSLGESPKWRATRSLPGMGEEHELRRYRVFGAVEPTDKSDPQGGGSRG